MNILLKVWAGKGQGCCKITVFTLLQDILMSFHYTPHYMLHFQTSKTNKYML